MFFRFYEITGRHLNLQAVIFNLQAVTKFVSGNEIFVTGK